MRAQDAMFYPAAEPMEVPRAACVGFRQDFWYHVGFWARRKDATDDNEQKYFFAELRFERRSRRLVVETCTLLGNLHNLSSSSGLTNCIHACKFYLCMCDM